MPKRSREDTERLYTCHTNVIIPICIHCLKRSRESPQTGICSLRCSSTSPHQVCDRGTTSLAATLRAWIETVGSITAASSNVMTQAAAEYSAALKVSLFIREPWTCKFRPRAAPELRRKPLPYDPASPSLNLCCDVFSVRVRSTPRFARRIGAPLIVHYPHE